MVSTEASFAEETLLKMAATPALPSDNVVFRVSRAVGLFPFDPQLQEDRLLLAYSVAVAGAVSVIGTVTMFEELPAGIGGTYHKLLVTACLGGHLLIFPCGLLQVYLRRVIFREALLVVGEVQSLMEGVGQRPVHSRTKLIPLIDVSLTTSSRFLLQYATGGYSLSLLFCIYTLVQFAILLVCSQYSYLVDTVGDVFGSAVDFLNGMVAVPQDGGRLCEVLNAMNRLAAAAEAINDVYSLQILLIMTMCFISFSINLYYIFIYGQLPIGELYSVLLPQVYGALFVSYVVWRLNQSSAQTKEKSKELNAALYKLMMDDTTKEVLHHGKLRLHIMMKREVIFTACGFFNLDYTLVHSMIASATAYLVILIQFGETTTL